MMEDIFPLEGDKVIMGVVSSPPHPSVDNWGWEVIYILIHKSTLTRIMHLLHLRMTYGISLILR